MEREIKIVPAWELEGDTSVLCQMIYDTIPSFYDLLPGDHAKKLELISRQLRGAKTEVSQAQVMLVDGEVGAYISYFVSEEFAARQMNGTVAVFSGLNHAERTEYLAALARHRTSYPHLPPNCLYLARMAVRERYRGSRVTLRLMNMFFDSFKDTGRYGGYIVKGNDRAHRYYEKFGFEKAEQSSDGEVFLYTKGVGAANFHTGKSFFRDVCKVDAL